MAALAKTLGLMLMMAVPGGLLVLMALVLASLVIQRWRLAEGTTATRLRYAMVDVRFRDVWQRARSL